MIMDLFHRARFAILKKKIKKNPFIGKENVAGLHGGHEQLAF